MKPIQATRLEMNESKLAEATRLESEQNFEGAIALLKDLVRHDPTCVEAYVHLAADSGILRRFRQAEWYARSALDLDPASGRARYYLNARRFVPLVAILGRQFEHWHAHALVNVLEARWVRRSS